MQLLYAMDAQQETTNLLTSEKALKKRFDQSRMLFFYVLNFIAETARYAEIDAKQRSSKYIVTEADKNVNIKIAGNEVLWKILESNAYNEALAFYHLPLEDDKDFVKKTYLKLTETDEYKKYIAVEERIKKSEQKILQFIFTDLLLEDEAFISHLEETFENWEDDGEALIASVMQALDKPHQLKFEQSAFIGKDKIDFATLLLKTVIDKDKYLSELIKPKLKNWDEDRIAVIDMILLKMGISELMYFETIPPKVTINEYIDIAKEYSTDNSGQFINGTLDNIKKDLLAEDKLYKTEFKRS